MTQPRTFPWVAPPTVTIDAKISATTTVTTGSTIARMMLLVTAFRKMLSEASFT